MDTAITYCPATAAAVNHAITRSCGTCRDRRILCDRTAPTCLQCIRSKRVCKGYGLRLSWPTKDDGRRALVLKQALQKSKSVYIPEGRRVHVSSSDVELHYHLANSTKYKRPQSFLCIPMPFDPILVDDKDKDLLQYFESVAFESLTTFDRDPKQLRNVLLRIALSKSNTSASTAVLRSLLGLASLHRYGLQGQAVEYKIAGLNALAAASKVDHLIIGEAIQHVAAGMLLCSIEVHQAACTSSQWTCYISGVKDVLKNASLNHSTPDSDLSSLLDWAYYHDVLGRFTLQHWLRDPKDLPPSWEPGWVEVDVQGLCFWTYWVQKGRMPYAESSNLRVLDLLSDVCDAVAWRQTDALSPDDFDDYSNYLDILDFRLRNLALPDPARESPDFAVVVELFQLAALVYLHRANANVLDAAARTQQYVDRAFVLFAQLPTCSRQFPLFILGSEARTDEQRAVVLDLMERTSRSASSRSLNHVRILLNAVWAQDDLAESEWGKGSEVGYWEKISGVISACSIVPSLV